MIEEPVQFTCEGKRLYGILHRPDKCETPNVVIIMVVGGPQTRIGSHRLFVQLARFLCTHGKTVLRFDYEGLGDSEGDFVGFKHAGPSIHAALETLTKRFPDNHKSIIWSLCDGSSASIIYAASNPDSIAGLVLCNPFTIIDERDFARTILRHYYVKRLMTIEFWAKLFASHVNIKETWKTLIETVKKSNLYSIGGNNDEFETQELPVPQLILHSLIKYPKPVKFILSTEDLAAKNFLEFLSGYKGIKQLIYKKRISQYFIKGADHTFTVPVKKMEMFKATLRAIHEIVNSEK